MTHRRFVCWEQVKPLTLIPTQVVILILILSVPPPASTPPSPWPFSPLQPTWLTHHGGLLPLPLLPDRSGGVGAHAGRGLQRRRRSQRRHQRRASLPGEKTPLQRVECAYMQIRRSSLQDPRHRLTRLPWHGCVSSAIFPPEAIKRVCPVYSPCRVTKCAAACLDLRRGKLAGSLKRKEEWNFQSDLLRSDCVSSRRTVSLQRHSAFSLPRDKGQCPCSIACLSEQPCLCHSPSPSPHLYFPHRSTPPRILSCMRTATCTLTTRPGR